VERTERQHVDQKRPRYHSQPKELEHFPCNCDLRVIHAGDLYTVHDVYNGGTNDSVARHHFSARHVIQQKCAPSNARRDVARIGDELLKKETSLPHLHAPVLVDRIRMHLRMKHAPVFAPGATVAKDSEIPAPEVHAVVVLALGTNIEYD